MDAREAVVVSLLMTSHAFMLRPDFADTTRLGPRGLGSFARGRCGALAARHPPGSIRSSNVGGRRRPRAPLVSRARSLDTVRSTLT